ncbi:tRNA pseudouridine(38-40) synthase TruA [Rhabdaerophilum calidifontis]|uniref:tRNA pseudouridine(38-40) synthase TruA n=1 Tax=Rhabdaerophilum calidifontis TaxID=2604328 RepID=UPI0012387CB4|nr:tRNA pseudouridine(38-40) synthase TruA [Rhabdaerophilum calidifontis]
MAETFRFRLDIEYFGAPYRGWQSQAGGRTVQDAIEAALARLGEGGRRLQCAGRTDAGVHALGQVAHVDLAKAWPADTLRDALNAHLAQAGESVTIRDAGRAPPGFDARLSAIRRHYRYRILNRRAPPALDRERVWHVARPLDAEAMGAAARTILGRHDFTTFRAASCQAKSPIRTLERLEVTRNGAEIWVEASARSFLHHQVRSMVGSLARVGHGVWPVAAMRAALDARDRARCGPVAPPDGLYFMAVDYPESRTLTP